MTQDLESAKQAVRQIAVELTQERNNNLDKYWNDLHKTIDSLRATGLANTKEFSRLDEFLDYLEENGVNNGNPWFDEEMKWASEYVSWASMEHLAPGLYMKFIRAANNLFWYSKVLRESVAERAVPKLTHSFSNRAISQILASVNPDEIVDEVSAQESFDASDIKIKELVKNATRVEGREAFAKVIKESDVVIPYKRAKYVDKSGVMAKITTFLNKKVQGSSFTSCKLIGPKAESVIGYGVLAGKSEISKASIKKFLDQHEGCVILRHKSMTPTKSTGIQNQLNTYLKAGTKYKFGLLFTSILNHWKKSAVDKKERDAFKKDKAPRAFICSNIVVHMFSKVGLNITFPKNIKSEEVWPKDILLSPSFTVVGVYFHKEAGM